MREVELNEVPQNLKSEAFRNCDALERFIFPTISYRLENIIQTGHWEELEDKLNEVRGVVQWESGVGKISKWSWVSIFFKLLKPTNFLRAPLEVVQWKSNELFVSGAVLHFNWNEIRRDLDRITRLVSYYELKDATTTFELALWKFNLDQADASNITNRAAHRLDVPGPVKDTILQYLDHI